MAEATHRYDVHWLRIATVAVCLLAEGGQKHTKRSGTLGKHGMGAVLDLSLVLDEVPHPPEMPGVYRLSRLPAVVVELDVVRLKVPKHVEQAET